MSPPRAQSSSPIRLVTKTPAEDVYDDGYLRVEHETYFASCDGQPIYLPRVEFLLLSRLSRSMNRVVKSEDLWRAAWAENKPLNCASLHVYIYRLRTKLLPFNLQIETLVNVGYRLVMHPHEPA